MADLAVDDEAGGQLDEAEVVARLLLPADQQPPEAVEPAVPDLHHPAPRRVAVGVPRRRQRLRRARLGRDVRRVAAGAAVVAARGVVVAPVQARCGGSVGAGSTTSRRPAASASFFMSVRLAPRQHARRAARPCPRSAGGAWCRTCRGRSGWRRSPPPRRRPLFAERGLDDAPVGGLPLPLAGRSRRRTRAAAPPRPAPGARRDPLREAGRGRWTWGRTRAAVAAHWLPVRASQISPSKIAPVVAAGPAGFLARLVDRQDRRRARAHRASSTRQIVGSSLLGGGRRGGDRGSSMPQGYHPPPLSGRNLSGHPALTRPALPGLRSSASGRSTTGGGEALPTPSRSGATSVPSDVIDAPPSCQSFA